MTAGYHLGRVAEDGSVERPWYVPDGPEGDIFDRFVRAKADPPQDRAGAEGLLRTTYDLCRASPAFFGHEFGDIALGSGGRGPFNQWTPGQRHIHAAVQAQRAAGRPVRIIVLKARREGVSTLCQLYAAWLTAFHPGRNGLIAAHEDEAARALFDIYRRFADSVPAAFAPHREEDTRKAIRFAAPVGGGMTHRTVAPGAGTKANAGKGRGQALQFLHASEASRWDEPETFWAGAVQCVEDYPETYILAESTANSFGWFKEMWDEAAAGWELRRGAAGAVRWVRADPRASRSDLVPVFLSWLEEPKYRMAFADESDRRALLADMDEDERALRDDLGATPEQIHWRRRMLWGSKFKGDLALFREEYPATPSEAFRSSGRRVFDMGALDSIERRIRRDGRQAVRWRLSTGRDGLATLTEADEGDIATWADPIPGREYAMGVDASYAKPAGDFMCAQVLDMRTWEQVASARLRDTDADEFGAICDALGRRYGEALAVVEINGPGLAVLKAMERLEYPEFYFRIAADDVTGQPRKTLGWWSNDKQRRWMVSELVAAVRAGGSGQGGLILNDHGTVEEMRGWVLKRSSSSNRPKEQPASGKGYDDRITALGLALVGGCLENGEGAGIVSHDEPAPARDVTGHWTHDPEVARMLGGGRKSDNGYDPVMGACL